MNKEIIDNILNKNPNTLELLVKNNILKSLKKSDINLFLAKLKFTLDSETKSKINSGEHGVYVENNKYEVLRPILTSSEGEKIEQILGAVRPKYRISFFKHQLENKTLYNLIIDLANKKSLTYHKFELNNVLLND